MVTGRLTRDDEAGETLVEVLVAIVVLGLAGVAVLAGLMLSATASDLHRKETTGSAYVRNYAEAVENYVSSDPSHYISCAQAGVYTPTLVGFTMPAGNYSWSQTKALAVSATGTTSACTTDTGVQMVTLNISTPDTRANETLVVVLRKPCAPSATPAC